MLELDEQNMLNLGIGFVLWQHQRELLTAVGTSLKASHGDMLMFRRLADVSFADS